MARPRKEGSLDELIAKQEERVAKAKAKYDEESKKLKEIYAQKNQIKQKELMKAIESSGKSVEDVIALINA